MGNQPPYRKQTSQSRYGNKKEVPSMATPRRPELPKKGGLLGFIFVLGILGGIVWLSMLIFGWGPYQPGAPEINVTATGTQFIFILSTPTSTGSPLVGVTSPVTQAVIDTPMETLAPELFPFILDGQPEAMTSDLIRPQLGCDYLVIAGQVWDLQGDPVTDSVQVHLFGELAGYGIDAYNIPGSALVYGQSGFEFVLKGLVVESETALAVQLEDVDGSQLSSPYDIQTYQDCQQNLILVNFKKVR